MSDTPQNPMMESQGSLFDGYEDMQGQVTEATSATEIVFPDDEMSEEEWKRALAGDLVEQGQYRLRITKVVRTAPTEEAAGGDRIHFTVVQGPGRPPEGGYPPLSRLFRVFANPNEGQRTAMRIDSEAKVRLLKALGYDRPPNLYRALLESVGKEVLATIKHRTVNDRVFQDIDSFRPV